MLQQFDAERYPRRLATVGSDVLPERLALPVGVLRRFRAVCRVDAGFLSSYPGFVRIHESPQRTRIEPVPGQNLKSCRHAVDVLRHNAWLHVARHPRRRQKQSVASARFGNAAIHTDRGVSEKVAESIRRLDAIKPQ